MNVIFGINAVAEALKARGRAFEWVGVAKERKDLRLQRLIQECRQTSIPVRFLPRVELDRMAGSGSHQGVVAITSSKQYSDLDDVIAAKRGEYSLVVVLDGVEDPHNLGAILRTADAAAADGAVIPERRAAGITGTVAKSSSGASEHLPVAKVTNIARSLEDLKAKGLWIVGLDERGKQRYDEVDYKMDCAVVLGAEGKGLHDLVARKCDFRRRRSRSL
jgi:23S rRNA (guanosine2251-2'-O)-methyltransferase